jgi:hypothetical protein
MTVTVGIGWGVGIVTSETMKKVAVQRKVFSLLEPLEYLALKLGSFQELEL